MPPLSEVTIVDSGVGNMLSVQRAFEHLGASVTIASDPLVVRDAARVVLPGVGAFGDAILELRRAGLDQAVLEVAERGAPLLGICLGMQLLLDESEEFGATAGLGLIPGRVTRLRTDPAEPHCKVPHVGWSALHPACRDWSSTLLEDVQPGEAVYFVHSFMAVPADDEHCVAVYDFAGHRVPALVQHRNVFGCQFHPEKSGAVGLRVLRRFLLA